MDEVYLVYVGTGFLYGVPARDLTKAEAEEHDEKKLLESGLYRKPTPSQNKLGRKPAENKE